MSVMYSLAVMPRARARSWPSASVSVITSMNKRNRTSGVNDITRTMTDHCTCVGKFYRHRRAATATDVANMIAIDDKNSAGSPLAGGVEPTCAAAGREC